MSSTTLAQFWHGIATTTEEMIANNYELWYMILGIFIAILGLTGVYYAMTYFFRKR